MNTRKSSAAHDAGYAGLTKIGNGLPTSYYLDDAHHQREMASIWRNNWVYACRSSEILTPRSYRTFELGDQSIFLVRDETGVLRGFYNTCRHRGAALCQNTHGKFPPAGIVCPYHNWRYGLQGQLRQTSSHLHPEGFELENFSLYKVAVTEWNGLVFVALTPEPPSFGTHFDQPLQRFDSWRLGELVSGHTFRKVVACNWKVFWENYNECLHCPGVHPRLSQLVPIFARGLQDERDDPHWQQHADKDEPQYRGGLRHGAQSWTMDGKPVGVPFPGLSDSDRKTGQVYMTCLPSAFIVAHVDLIGEILGRTLGMQMRGFVAVVPAVHSANCDTDRLFPRAETSHGRFGKVPLRDDGRCCKNRAVRQFIAHEKDRLIAQLEGVHQDRGARIWRLGGTPQLLRQMLAISRW